MIKSRPNPRKGLCKRVSAAYDIFLKERTHEWFFRAIDDTWINPDNLLEFVDDLANVVNPMTDIVIKACRNIRLLYQCTPWPDGGTGWLMSRAGVMHIVEYDFTKICNQLIWHQDDATIGLLACHTFPDQRFWHSWRMPGDPFYFRGLHLPRFSDVKEKCPHEDVWPVRRLVVYHTQGLSALQEMVMTAGHVVEDLAFIVRRDDFTLCRGIPAKLAERVGLEEVRRTTPIVKFQKGGRKMSWNMRLPHGPLACRQCIYTQDHELPSEQERQAEWNRTGWHGFYGDWQR
jgi:hypothetical protein